MLDFDAVVPGHGDVTNKAEMRKFREATLRLRTRVTNCWCRRSRGRRREMLQSEFRFAELHLQR